MNRRDLLARPTEGADRVAARSVAAIRLFAVLVTAAIGAYVPDLSGKALAFFLVVGLVEAPAAIVVLFAVESGNRTIARSGWLVDLFSVFAFQVLAPNQVRVALVLYVVCVIAAGYLVRSVATTVIAAIALVLAMAGQYVVPDAERAKVGDLLLFAAITVAVTIVAELAAADRRRANATAVRLEGRAAAILDKVADAVVLTDAAGEIRSLNPAARKLTGIKHAGTSTCAKLLNLHDGERALDCSMGCALLALDPEGAGVRVWRGTADGRRQPLLASAAEVGGGAEIVHSLRDITKLVEADEAKTLFLATTSHELKTPLTVINGFASTLLREPDLEPPLREAALTAIHTRSLELSKMVDRLLMSSRIEAGSLSLTLEATDVTTAIQERIDAVRAATAKPIVTAIDGVPPAWANGDAVASVVEHLVENAIKYGDDNEIYVTLTHEGRHAILTVIDHGIGMDAHQAERCFDKFWQGESGDARRFDGTGIGLYVAKSLVDAMHGEIGVRSTPGEGSEFTVRLPLDPPASPQVPPQRAPEPSMIREFMRQIGVEGGV